VKKDRTKHTGSPAADMLVRDRFDLHHTRMASITAVLRPRGRAHVRVAMTMYPHDPPGPVAILGNHSRLGVTEITSEEDPDWRLLCDVVEHVDLMPSAERIGDKPSVERIGKLERLLRLDLLVRLVKQQVAVLMALVQVCRVRAPWSTPCVRLRLQCRTAERHIFFHRLSQLQECVESFYIIYRKRTMLDVFRLVAVFFEQFSLQQATEADARFLLREISSLRLTSFFLSLFTPPRRRLWSDPLHLPVHHLLLLVEKVVQRNVFPVLGLFPPYPLRSADERVLQFFESGRHVALDVMDQMDMMHKSPDWVELFEAMDKVVMLSVEEALLAFAMSGHPRVGAQSAARCLDAALLRVIGAAYTEQCFQSAFELDGAEGGRILHDGDDSASEIDYSDDDNDDVQA
jgi:hypothetical protein